MFGLFKIIKGLLISEEGTLTPKQIDITPGGSASTKTSIVSSQTANRTITIPDATDTLVGKATTDTLINKTIVVANNTITTAASGNLTSTELNAALSELQTDVDTRATSAALTAHITNATAAHAASAISNTPSGNLSATNVQTALNEVQSDVDTRVTTVTFDAHVNSSTAHGVSGNVVGTTDTQTLSNKTINSTNVLLVQDSLVVIQDNVDSTKKFKFDAANVTTGTTRTFQVPNADTTLVGTDATQTLTNKTMVVASNTITTAASGNLTSTELNAALAELQTDIDTRQTSGNYITALTGDVTASGPGSVAGTIANDAVTNAKLNNMATQTIKGRTTAGTGDPEDLTATQATAILNSFVGDSGSGGTKGLVPAPITGDATKYLKGDGTWSTVSSGGGFTYTAKTANYTAVAGEYVDCTSGTFTVTLPTAASISGQSIKVVNSGTGTITINTTSSQTISGYASAVLKLTNSRETFVFVSNGTNWILDQSKLRSSNAQHYTGSGGAASISSNGYLRINDLSSSTGNDITATQDATNGSTFTFNRPGWATVQISADVTVSASFAFKFYVNGSLYKFANTSISQSSATQTLSVGCFRIPVAQGDNVRMFVGGSNVGGGLTNNSHFATTLDPEY